MKEMNSDEYKLSSSCQIKELPELLKMFLGYKKEGFFVEFGAFDGEYVSNTAGLADMGWKGIYIEPILEYFQKCTFRHKNNDVKVLNLAVGDEDKLIQISKGGPLSTISNEMIDRFNSLDWSKGYHNDEWEKVQQKKLEDILTECNAPAEFELMSIDVEGYEWNALKDFNLKKWNPKIVVIELHDNNPNYPHEWLNCKNLIEYFERNNYRPVYKDLTNTVYLRNDLDPVQNKNCAPLEVLSEDTNLIAKNTKINESLRFMDSLSEDNNLNEKKVLLTKLLSEHPENHEVKARYTVLSQLSDEQEHIVCEPRIDYFIIWGNGLQYKNEILQFLRSDRSLQLLSITHHKLESIKDFIVKLYETDAVPWEHLIAKTRYLLKTRPEIEVIIVKNLSPREKYFGKGQFRHIQCEKIKIIKEILRNKYNPRIDSQRTEEHIIHASDYESQTEHLLKLLNFGTLDYYKSASNRFLNLPHHMPVINNFTLKKVDLNKIYCSIITGEASDCTLDIVPIQETPHYKYLKGNKSEYEEYYNKYSGSLLTDDHNPQAFDRLIGEFNYASYMLKGNYILLEPLENGNYKIWDGVHRAAILKSKEDTLVTSAVLNV